MSDRFVDELLRWGAVNDAQVQAARKAVQERGGLLPTRLIEQGARSVDVLSALWATTGVAVAPASMWRTAEAEPSPCGVTKQDALKNLCAPLGVHDGTLRIAYADPEVAQRAADLGLPTHKPVLADEAQVRGLLQKIYGEAPPATPPVTVPPVAATAKKKRPSKKKKSASASEDEEPATSDEGAAADDEQTAAMLPVTSDLDALMQQAAASVTSKPQSRPVVSPPPAKPAAPAPSAAVPPPPAISVLSVADVKKPTTGSAPAYTPVKPVAPAPTPQAPPPSSGGGLKAATPAPSLTPPAAPPAAGSGSGKAPAAPSFAPPSAGSGKAPAAPSFQSGAVAKAPAADGKPPFSGAVAKAPRKPDAKDRLEARRREAQNGAPAAGGGRGLLLFVVALVIAGALFVLLRGRAEKQRIAEIAPVVAAAQGGEPAAITRAFDEAARRMAIGDAAAASTILDAVLSPTAARRTEIEALWMRGEARERTGDKLGARADLQRFLDLSEPVDPRRGRAVDAISRLQP